MAEQSTIQKRSIRAILKYCRATVSPDVEHLFIGSSPPLDFITPLSRTPRQLIDDAIVLHILRQELAQPFQRDTLQN